ncbi:MAG: AAA family ATPase [Proteobacteria bacterium]|nr:AAA family ATPase [Pseudomonadota bacterium]
MRFDTFAEACNNLNSEMDFCYKSIAPSIEFSNTGRRGGKKYFSITLITLISVLKDIRNNIGKFSPNSDYVEGIWRDLFSEYLTDPAVNALSTVQTLPLFAAIGKTLHIVNTPDALYSDKSMTLNTAFLTAAIDYLESQLPDEELYFSTPSATHSTAKKGENIIYYGAPGTGKSHTIDDEVDEANTIRTVFHADTTNSDFMGCLKPKMNGGAIEYEFRPGPFTNAVCNAIKDPEHHHWLVIEEINRAPAAAVFGEIFQLLDREHGTGGSRYSITLSDLDMRAYIEKETDITLEQGKLSLPGNLTLLATMNSSDQAVMPLDTAFKRRWQFRYIPLDFDESYKAGEKACADGNLKIPDRAGREVEVSWKNFATTINTLLTEQDIPEDRHLGPFFLSEEEMKNNPKEALTGKLFMYLWDDVLRHGMKDTVFDSEVKTYGQLTRKYNNSEKIFSDSFYHLLVSEYFEPESLLREVAEENPDYKTDE